MKHVYEQGWKKTLVKLLLLGAAYNVVLIAVLILTAGSTAALVHASGRYPWLVDWLLR